jgi:riboflavin-specific deaminase-like protein
MSGAIEVSQRVWERLLAVRTNTSCTCCGGWSESEHRALDLYGPLARRDLGTMTIGQVGQSLDGRIATPTDDARDISGPDGLTHLHRMRALVDGVIVGANTALHDQPRLTVRLCEGPHPARILIDPRGRVPDDAPLFTEDGTRRVVIQAVDHPRPEGVEVIQLTALNNRLDPVDILSALHASGLHTLLVEGGGVTLGWFIDSGLLDRLHVAIAPVIIGGGPQGLTLPTPPALLKEALRPSTEVFSLGSDVVVDAALTDKARFALNPLHSS